MLKFPILPSALFAALMVGMASAAMAASLTQADFRYLEGTYGVASSGNLIRSLSADDRATLHALINDASLKSPTTGEFGPTRDYNVADFLFAAYMRECSVWELSQSAPPCPRSADAQAEPGKEIADRECNACHLFGTLSAPPFIKLARAGKPTEEALAEALARGHSMSPILLRADEIKAVALYIRSLKVTSP